MAPARRTAPPRSCSCAITTAISVSAAGIASLVESMSKWTAKFELVRVKGSLTKSKVG
jgi:hypothetical protein